MARLDRFKYIPMFVRAYQEAWNQRPDVPNNRSDSQSTEAFAREAPVGSGTNTRSQPQNRVRMSPSRPVSNRNKAQAVTRRSHYSPARHNSLSRRSEKPQQHRVSAHPRHVLQSASRLGTSQTHAGKAGKPGRSRGIRNTPDPLVGSLLREMRSTKRQLNQLQTIQMELSEVQSKLDQQLQVLRRSVASVSKSDGMLSTSYEHTDS